MKKWQVLGLTALLSASLAVTGCDKQSQDTKAQTADKSDKKATIGFAHCCVRGEISIMDKIEDTIKNSAQKNGANLIFESAEDSKHRGDLTIQPAIIRRMIDQGTKVIILNSALGKGAQEKQEEMVSYAQSKGVFIVAVQRVLPKTVHAKYPNAISVVSASKAPGLMQGKLVGDLWKTHPEWDKNGNGLIELGLLKGAEGYPKTIDRTRGFYEALDVESKRIAEEFTNWDRKKAKEITESWIKSGKFNTMEIIVCNSDDAALGAIDAIEEAKKPLIPIFGINATPDGQIAVKDGKITGTILQDIEEQARVSYQVAENIALGKKPTDGVKYKLEGGEINIPYSVITAENIGQYLK